MPEKMMLSHCTAEEEVTKVENEDGIEVVVPGPLQEGVVENDAMVVPDHQLHGANDIMRRIITTTPAEVHLHHHPDIMTTMIATMTAGTG